MSRYVIVEDRAIWAHKIYQVEAESADDAKRTYRRGDYEFLGYSLNGPVASVPVKVSCEQTDATPHMDHPANQRDREAFLLRPIADLNLSVRSRKCLIQSGINTIAELVERTPEDLLECKNSGISVLTEVRDNLRLHGLKLRDVPNDFANQPDPKALIKETERAAGLEYPKDGEVIAVNRDAREGAGQICRIVVMDGNSSQQAYCVCTKGDLQDPDKQKSGDEKPRVRSLVPTRRISQTEARQAMLDWGYDPVEATKKTRNIEPYE